MEIIFVSLVKDIALVYWCEEMWSRLYKSKTKYFYRV